MLYKCTLCDSTNINTIIEFVPYVSGDGFNGGSDSYLQFRDTCGKRMNINLILERNHIGLHLENEVVKTQTIVSNNPVLLAVRICLCPCHSSVVYTDVLQ